MTKLYFTLFTATVELAQVEKKGRGFENEKKLNLQTFQSSFDYMELTKMDMRIISLNSFLGF